MLPSTVERVPQHSPEAYNAAIRRRTEENVARLAAAGPAVIDRRLAELDREWDIERTLEANAATVSLIGSGLGFTVNRRFFALPVVVAGFLLQHALQGWCPPRPALPTPGLPHGLRDRPRAVRPQGDPGRLPQRGYGRGRGRSPARAGPRSSPPVGRPKLFWPE